MTVADFMAIPHKEHVRPRAICKDGFSVSIQGSEYHYSCPRSNSSIFSEVELGFPSCVEALWLNYAVDKDHALDTVYGYVPVDVVEAVISKHGGII